ncbi:MAG: hypothetical protein ACKOE9_01970 [Vulcanococcus sp.]
MAQAGDGVAETVGGFSRGATYAPAERNLTALPPLLAVLLITALIFGLSLL